MRGEVGFPSHPSDGVQHGPQVWPQLRPSSPPMSLGFSEQPLTADQQMLAVGPVRHFSSVLLGMFTYVFKAIHLSAQQDNSPVLPDSNLNTCFHILRLLEDIFGP